MFFLLLKIYAHDFFFFFFLNNPVIKIDPRTPISALMGQPTKSKIVSVISYTSSEDGGGRVAVKSECLFCLVYPLYMPGGRSETHCITYKI